MGLEGLESRVYSTIITFQGDTWKARERKADIARTISNRTDVLEIWICLHVLVASAKLPEPATRENTPGSQQLSLGLQPYPQKVVRPRKPTPTTFSGGGWSPRVLQFRWERRLFSSTAYGLPRCDFPGRKSTASGPITSTPTYDT